MDIMSKYETSYKLNYKVFEYEYDERIIFDLKKNFVLEASKPTLIFDVDHTLLKVSPDLKDALNNAVVKKYASLPTNAWLETYKEAKTKENFYDYKYHCQILAKLISSKKNHLQQIAEDIETTIFETIDTVVPKLAYKNFLDFINTLGDKYNLIIATSGSGTFQRRKVASLINSFTYKPQLIVFIENLHKGTALNNISASFPELSKFYLFDDNISELADVSEKCDSLNVNLMRVKQAGGVYTEEKSKIEEKFIILDFKNYEDLNISIYID